MESIKILQLLKGVKIKTANKLGIPWVHIALVERKIETCFLERRTRKIINVVLFLRIESEGQTDSWPN